MDNNEEEEAAAATEQLAASQLIGEDDDIRKTALPTVLRWDGGGKNVTISGTFSNWKPITMVRSHQNFVTIIDLPEGDHQYKFCVDGEWKHDPKLVSWAENQYTYSRPLHFQCLLFGRPNDAVTDFRPAGCVINIVNKTKSTQ